MESETKYCMNGAPLDATHARKFTCFLMRVREGERDREKGGEGGRRGGERESVCMCVSE